MQTTDAEAMRGGSLMETFDAFQKDISQRHEAAYPDDPPPKSPFDIMLFIPTDLTEMLDDHFISWSDWRLIKLVEPATFIDRHTRTDREYRFQP